MFYNLLKFTRRFFAMDYNSANFTIKHTYEECIKTLNELISNVSVINKSSATGPDYRSQHIPRTKMFCKRAGITMSEIDHLNIVHVAGTKGKGSTCIYIDSILHKQGYKTGLFTSPHLTEVRERIKINGKPISMDDFNYFFRVIYNKLSSAKEHENDMPFYFQFLTVMAFEIFIREKVDFVILETGIGGRFDTTNIISAPRISCITSLGFDHIEILGKTMSEISWNKAGIIKTGSVVLTCDNQPKEALDVIANEVKMTNSKLYLVPINGRKMLNIIDQKVGIHCENALLASTICQILLNEDFVSSFDVDDNQIVEVPPNICLTEEYKEIIYSTTNLGRYQKITKSLVEYYIDGAHTVESLKTSVEWFREVVADRRYEKRYLIFMITGPRSVEDLLSQLTTLDFDGILLSPIIPFQKYQPCDFAADDANIERDKSKLSEIAATWSRLNRLTHPNKIPLIKYFPCFSDIDHWLVDSGKCNQVLVVGSLHLVGCALVVLA